MNSYKYFLLISLVGCFFSSCETNNSSDEFVPEPVVEGYLYEGAPIKNLRVYELVKFDLINDFSEKVLAGLDIRIKIDDVEYPLTEELTRPGYYSLPDDNLTLLPGQIVEFNFNYNSIPVSSQTSVPSKPVNLSMSETVKYVSPVESFWDLAELAEISVQISWTNSDNAYYTVSVKNIENNPPSIDPNGYLPDMGSSFDIPPLITDFSNIFFNKIKYYGKYIVVVSKINPEYAALYQSQNQDSRDLIQAISNIENGYGIFTALASDTAYFEIRKP